MKRFVCVHGHFYQPPRENPWLEAVEIQDSAYPYHDWNERVTAECYAANAAARILDGRGRIERIANNYARISFNFGPTLLSWLQRHDADVYAAILAADAAARARFSGHGAALAQAYNHVIMPLATRADKTTQVCWGIADFRRRFGREPEGMWLPETAADLETLDLLAEHGIRFTLLAPHQAARVRRTGEREWRDVSGGRVDPKEPYLVRLASGRSIAVFFYDGPVSRAVAFERLLENGGAFARRLLGLFDPGRGGAQLVHLATDGETYGHHHRFGEMALAFALDLIERDPEVALTNYGEYLERHPPVREVEIVPLTSWSCGHGIERWRSDCGCNSGSHHGWHQGWRGPLREALDWLRDTANERFRSRMGELFADPAAARDAYVEVVLDRSAQAARTFLARHEARELAAGERVEALKLLEMQRNLQLMYTSCGWFFDDISGIETVQVLQYAARAMQLAGELSPEPLEPRFLALLERAPSNRPDLRDGRGVYERLVRPAMRDLEAVGAHVAVASLFDNGSDRFEGGCWDVRLEDRHQLQAGRLRLAMGKLRVGSRLTLEEARLAFAVLHFGDHNLSCGVATFAEEPYRTLLRECRDAFSRADVPEVIRLLDRHFSGLTYSLGSLFRDEQRRILGQILAATLAEAETEYGRLFDQHAPLMRFLAGLAAPQPRAFQAAAEVVLNARLRRTVEDEPIDLERARSLLRQAEEHGVPLDREGLAFVTAQALDRLGRRMVESPEDVDLVRHAAGVAGFAVSLPFEVDLWRIQNHVHALREGPFIEQRERAASRDPGASAWVEAFVILAELLGISTAPGEPE
jgi:alpha-amylase/alpha-mannosidase (GH57 family)